MAGHDRITADGRKFKKQIEQLKKLEVRVGFQQGEAQADNGVDMVDIAMFNELGTENIPSRPFLRQSVDSNAETINQFCKAQLNSIAQGKTAEQVLNAIGVMQKGLVQEKITDSPNWATPNADSTIKKKKSNVPLIDKGTMRQSVSYVITSKGGGNR